MKISNKATALIASLLLAAPMLAGAESRSVDNWVSSAGLPWKNGSGSLCWRDSAWTPRTATDGCDGAIVQAAEPMPMPPPAEAQAAPMPPASAPLAPPAPMIEKLSFSADAYFDFDRTIVKPQAKANMDAVIARMQGAKVDIVIATGHTDAVGTADYNQKLSVRRADAVRDYLVSRGIDRSHVYTEGKGAAQPVADNRTAEGRARNRRVEIEIVGQR